MGTEQRGRQRRQKPHQQRQQHRQQHRMKSPIQRHRSCDCKILYVFIWKIDMVKIKLFLNVKIYEKHCQTHGQQSSKTWAKIVNKHGNTSSTTLNNRQTRFLHKSLKTW
jgi:hypothetical protein